MMTNSKLNYWKKYCCEPLELVESYAAAEADNFAGWCIHHRLEIQQDKRVSRQELKDKDLYFHRPASELVFMKVSEHHSLHHKDKVISAEARKRISEALKGEKCYIFGKHLSEETRQKMSEAHKGKHRSEDHCKKIAEARKGMHWWNNGISNKCSRECPGEGWTRGFLSAKFKY